MNNQKGFGALGIILIIFLILAIGFAGWFVWKNNSDKVDDYNGTTQQPNYEPENTETVDPLEGWTELTNEQGVYSFKYPANWVKANVNTESCPTTTMLAPSQESLGKCPSSQMGQIYVVSGEQYVNGDCALNAEYYKDVQESSATADGIAGKKIIGTVEGMEGEVFEGALPDDTEVICYFFSTNDNDYKIRYTQKPADQDVAADFNKMVTRTFKF